MMLSVTFACKRQKVLYLLNIIALFLASSLFASPSVSTEDLDFSFTDEMLGTPPTQTPFNPKEIGLPIIQMNDGKQCTGYLVAQNKLLLTEHCKDSSGAFPTTARLTFFGCERGPETIWWPDRTLKAWPALLISANGRYGILTFSPKTLHSTCWAREYTRLGASPIDDESIEAFSGSGSGLPDAIDDNSMGEFSGSGDDEPSVHGIRTDKRSTSYRIEAQNKPSLYLKEDIQPFITKQTGCDNIEKLCLSQKIQYELARAYDKPALENMDQICADSDNPERVCIIQYSENHPEGQCQCKLASLPVMEKASRPIDLLSLNNDVHWVNQAEGIKPGDQPFRLQAKKIRKITSTPRIESDTPEPMEPFPEKEDILCRCEGKSSTTNSIGFSVYDYERPNEAFNGECHIPGKQEGSESCSPYQLLVSHAPKGDAATLLKDGAATLLKDGSFQWTTEDIVQTVFAGVVFVAVIGGVAVWLKNRMSGKLPPFYLNNSVYKPTTQPLLPK